MYCKIVFLCSRPSEKRGNRQFHVVIIIAKAPIKSTVDSMIRKPPHTHTHTHTSPPPPSSTSASRASEQQSKEGEKKRETRKGEHRQS